MCVAGVAGHKTWVDCKISYPRFELRIANWWKDHRSIWYVYSAVSTVLFHVHLMNVLHVWSCIQSFISGDDVRDRSSLKTIFSSNLGYAGTVTPTAMAADGEHNGEQKNNRHWLLLANGISPTVSSFGYFSSFTVYRLSGSGYIPKLESRLFWEDVPFGLCILKSIATMLGNRTPTIDFMIEWHQQFMGKQFLLPDKTLNKELFPETVSASISPPLERNVITRDMCPTHQTCSIHHMFIISGCSWSLWYLHTGWPCCFVTSLGRHHLEALGWRFFSCDFFLTIEHPIRPFLSEQDSLREF